MPDAPDLADPARFAAWAEDVARFGDTDRLGHVNNAAFATYCESGRVALLWECCGGPPEGSTFVIARLELDFRAEMQWGGPVRIGNAVLGLGRSSVRIGQGIFRDGTCCATSVSVIVLMDEATRRATPLPEPLRARLSEWTAR